MHVLEARLGALARRADRPDRLPPPDRVAPHPDLGEVAVDRTIAALVVNDHDQSAEVPVVTRHADPGVAR